MADRWIAMCIFMITFQQYVTGRFTDRWSRFEKEGHVLDVDSQYISLLETLSNTNLQGCASLAAFYPLVLWFVYNSASRKCLITQCSDIPTEEHPHSNNVLYRKHGASVPRSCSDVKTSSPGAEDGEYWLHPDAPTFLGCPTKIYCQDMDTDNPAEYVTLPAVNMGVYPDRSNIFCSGEISLTGNGIGMNGATNFTKISVEITTMKVTSDDYTFATWNGTKHRYAIAADCYNKATYPQCGPVGTFHINTEGTGMIVSMQQTWTASGYKPFAPNVTRSADGRQIDLLCGGRCGSCSPDGGLQLHRDPLGGSITQDGSF